MRISLASAIASPAPGAGPGSAAIVGFPTATSVPVGALFRSQIRYMLVKRHLGFA